MECLSHCCYRKGRCVTIQYASTQAQLECLFRGMAGERGLHVSRRYLNGEGRETSACGGENAVVSLCCAPGTEKYLTYLSRATDSLKTDLWWRRQQCRKHFQVSQRYRSARGGGGERAYPFFFQASLRAPQKRGTPYRFRVRGKHESSLLTNDLAAHSIGICLIRCYSKVVLLYCDVHRNAIEVGGGKTCPT